MQDKLSWSKTERVVRAYGAGHRLSSDIDVSALESALGTSEGEVRRRADRPRRHIDRSGMPSAALTFGVIATAALALTPEVSTKEAYDRSRYARPASILIVADSQDRVRTLRTNKTGRIGP